MTLVPRSIALAIATLLLAGTAAGREVVFGVEQSITADSNIFNQTVDPTAE